MSEVKFVSALRFRWLTPLYDFFVGITMPDAGFKNPVIRKKFKTIFGEVQIIKAVKQQ